MIIELTGESVQDGKIVASGGWCAPPNFSFDIYLPPRRRTFWQWLRRKPKISRRIYLPSLTVERGGIKYD